METSVQLKKLKSNITQGLFFHFKKTSMRFVTISIFKRCKHNSVLDQYGHEISHGNQLPIYFLYVQTVYFSMLLFSFYWGHKGFYKMRTRKGNLCQNFARMHFIIQFPIPSIASSQCTLFNRTFHFIQYHWIDLIMVGSQFCSDVPSARPAWSKCQAPSGKCSTISEGLEVSSDLIYQQRELV